MLVKREEGHTSASLPESIIAASKDDTPEEAKVPRICEVIDLTISDDDEEYEDDNDGGDDKDSEDKEDNEDDKNDKDDKDSENNEDNENKDDCGEYDTNYHDDDNDNYINDDDDTPAALPANVPRIDQAQAPSTAASIPLPSLSLPTESVLPVKPPQASSLTKKRSRPRGVVDLITHLLAGGGECGRASKVRKLIPPNDGEGDNEETAEKEQAKDNDRTKGPSNKIKNEKGKYRVTWKEDSLLEEVRLFHKSEEEGKGNGLGLSHQDEGAVLRRKVEALEWYGPIPLSLPPLVEELLRDKVAIAGEQLVIQEEDDLIFDADNPQEMGIRRDAESRLSGDHTGLLAETAEIPWPNILLEGMEGVEYPEPMPDSLQQIVLPTTSLHQPRAPQVPQPPQTPTSPSLPPPRLRPVYPLSDVPREKISSEGRHQLHSERRDEVQGPGQHQVRRQSTDASQRTASNRIPLPDRPGMRRYSMPERPQDRRTSPSNREHSIRSSPSDKPEREAERFPVPERPHKQGSREHSPLYESKGREKSKARYERREENEPDKRHRLERVEESDLEFLRHEERDSSEFYHYERKCWRYNEERDWEGRYDRYYRHERRIAEEGTRSFRRPSTGERATHGERDSGRSGSGDGGTTPTTPTYGHKGDVEVPRRHNSLSSHDRPGQHRSDEYGCGSKQSTYWNNNQDVTYPYRQYTNPDRESERRVGTKEKSEGARL